MVAISLRARLLIGFGVVAALMIGFASYMLLQEAQIREQVQYLASEQADVQNRLEDLRDHLSAVQRNTLQAALNRDPELLQFAIKDSALLYEVFDALRQESASSTSIQEQDRAKLFRFLDQTEVLYREITVRSFATLGDLAAGRATDPRRVARLRLDSIRLNSAFAAYLTDARGDSAIRLQSFLEHVERLRPISLSTASLAALALAMFLLLLHRHLTLPLRRLTEFVGKISDPANMRERLAVGRPNEIGRIGTAVNSMLDRLHDTTVSRDHFDHIVANLSNALIVTDANGRIDTINRAACEALGAAEASLLGQPVAQRLPSAIAEPLSRNCGLRDVEVDFVTADSQHRPMLVSATALEGEEGGFVIVATDIAERKRAEADIRATLAKQRELSSLKSRFVSMMSHEFRTPLSAIQSSTELLKYYSDRLPPAEKDELMRNIEDSIARMVRMLDDVLLLGRADAGRLVFNPKPVDLAAVCNTVVTERRLASGRNIDVQLAIHGVCADPVLDENLLRHTLANLLSNAVKYSPEGGTVRIEVSCDPKEITLCVADHGIGIATQDLPHLFDSFYRASNVGNIAGTGLGLAIVKAAVKLHGGSIRVDSELGKGTRFVVTLPSAVPVSNG